MKALYDKIVNVESGDKMRVDEHPILTFKNEEKLFFTYNGKKLQGFKGDTIAAALVDNGIMHFSNSIIHKRPRGFYCAIGNCGSCNMTVNGIDNVKTCMTLLEEGMIVVSQVTEELANDI
jgi:hypothetical protein